MENDELTRDNCKSCGVAWENHDGVERTCDKLQVAIKALKWVSEYSFCSAESEVANKALEVILGN
jgi:hypothetical protein